MPDSPSDVYALLESSFSTSPNLRSHKPLPRRSDSYRRYEPAASKEAPLWRDDETDTLASSELPTPSPSETIPAMTAADSGLPPTPPSNSQDGLPTSDYSPPSHADSVVTSLTSRKSTLSTPVNQRSPPTPDPSPPRRTTASMTTPERPVPFTHPSSRAESFTTAREEPSSSELSSRSSTPTGARLSVVEEDRGLGLAFENEEDDITPRNTVIEAPLDDGPEGTERELGGNGNLRPENIPNREYDTNLMRNVTVRRRKPSPRKEQVALRPASPEPSTATLSTPRRTSSLRERVEASKYSPHTPSIENFAKSIGWPTEASSALGTDNDQKRFSSASMSSTVVEATVVLTPPQRRRTLRHSGKNLAYRIGKEPESPMEHEATIISRTPIRSEDVPLHRLIHKRASISDRWKRLSVDSSTMGDRTASPASLRQRAEESAAVTLAHQRSIKSVLQPAADIMSRSNSVTRNQPTRNSHKRIVSAPEAAGRLRTPSISHSVVDVSPPESPSPKRERKTSSRLAYVEAASSSSPVSDVHNLLLPKLISREPEALDTTPNTNKLLPEIPPDSFSIQSPETITMDEYEVHDPDQQDARPPSAMLDRVRHLLIVNESPTPNLVGSPQTQEPLHARASSTDTGPTVRRGSVSTRGRSEERRRSSISQDRTSRSPRETILRSSLDGVHNEEFARSSHEWHSFQTDENGRVSFDRSTIRTDEHAMARHLFSQTTPFSQFSDTPIEVSEATAVSIYPHNNNSLLVVQQGARASLQPQDQLVASDVRYATPNIEEIEEPSTPPFVDAVESPDTELQKPTFTIEPSTPPMQIDLPTFGGAVDSPLKNPRKPPEPPVIKFIPPTPAEELERQLVATVPGPPKRSDSHPQRRLSLKQRARRYSDNLISPFLARASSMRGRSASVSHHGHGQPQIPSVNDEDGSLHPFWRPRGFWDGFEDSDSDSETDVLPAGGDTSDIEDDDSEPPSPRRLGVLGRRLTNGFKTHNSFHIGNSLGVERSGTNKRKPHINFPPRGISARTTKREAPKIIIQPPTMSFRRTHSARILKRPSRASLASSSTFERPRRRPTRETWRQGRRIPGFKGVQVQYIGLSGVKQRFREKRAERRREALRKSIGGRWYVEPGTPGGAIA